jgi:Gpi18-like mannosyltransferase
MRTKDFVLLMVAAFLGACIFMPPGGQGTDVGAFQRWAILVHQKGLSHAYDAPGVDYNPLYLELLWLFGLIQGSVEALNTSFFTFKIFVLAFDFGAVSFTAYMLRRNGRNIALACLLLFNPAYLYITVIWGQVDSLLSVFVAFSVVLATRKKVLASFLCLQLAFNFKLIGVVYVPLVVLLNLPAIREEKRVLLRTLPLLLAVQVLIFLPFLAPHKLQAILAANLTHLRDSPSSASPSGFNFWYLVFGERTWEVSSTRTFLRVSIKTWGVVMFAVSAVVVLAPLLKATVLRKTPLRDAYLFLTSALYGLSFYCFTVGMHERYSQPIILLLAIYAVLSGNYFVYVLASIALFLNLEKVNLYFHLATYQTLIFRNAFIGSLFLVVLVVGVAQLYLELRPTSRLARADDDARDGLPAAS